MSCTPTPAKGELDFVLALHERTSELTSCCGPALTLKISMWRAYTLEMIFDSRAATELFWDGHEMADLHGSAFTLCGGHWLDLAALLWLRSRDCQRPDWYAEADHLLRDVCSAARWDPKEIVNFFRWQSIRLT